MTKRDLPLKVIVWGTGSVGTEVLQTILDIRDDLEVVGVRVYSDEKVGVDAGDLAKRSTQGVLATTNSDDIIALDADCVIYTPRKASLDDVCAILESGKNVVTTAFLFHPRRLDPADLARLTAACEKGGVSVHGSGLNPGNLSAVLPLALSGMTRSIEKVTLQERADWSVYESTEITFNNMCFGQPVESISPTANEFLAFNSSLFSEMVWFIADSLNADIDTVTADVEAIAAMEDHQIFDHLLKAGTTAGQHWRWVGRRGDEELVEIEALWTVGGEYPGHWPKPQDGWTLTIEGDPSMQVHFISLASFTREVPLEDHVHAASVATAMQITNAIQDVCAAAPGPVTAADLPLIRSYGGFGNTPRAELASR
ncbi:NAD(P)H-dependent amine dehydrogenase family protein [Gordonia rhizosphera]|uniref:Uncharacterized protein n=1 Tax=Gordonia rhizosphera NBRC 16068 TaxID=1108045 RepID=K6WFW4_9ACTN|nr:dihydrodipicolinate reductase [Gordonia rhizosphera]GAB92661.1 hypothetical protein GORHZ_186_00310 [Gordonia rhizosphera NBRC 16068]